MPCSRLHFAGNEAKQSRLARTVFSDEGDAVFPVDEESYVVEYRLGRKLHFQGFYRDHFLLNFRARIFKLICRIPTKYLMRGACL